MGFKITQTGPHDSSAGVVHVDYIKGPWAFGIWIGRPITWSSADGHAIYGPHACSITGVHVEPKPADNRPDPGNGWRLLEDGEVIEVETYGFYTRANKWEGPMWTTGITVTEHLRQYPCYSFYKRRIPKPAETWTPTARFQDRVLNRDNGGPIPDGAFWSYRGGESKLVVREQCWVCGDREAWRVPEITKGGE